VVLHVALLSPWTKSVVVDEPALISVLGWLFGSTSISSYSGSSSTGLAVVSFTISGSTTSTSSTTTSG
jgi:hypothetical protein